MHKRREAGTCWSARARLRVFARFYRVADEDAERVQAWAERLGVDRSELLREAVRQHLLRLASKDDAAILVESPLESREQTLTAIADWGPSPGR